MKNSSRKLPAYLHPFLSFAISYFWFGQVPPISRRVDPNNPITLRLAGYLLLFLLSLGVGYSQNPPAGFSATTIASGWIQPVGICFANDGRMIVWEKAGKVWMLDKNAAG